MGGGVQKRSLITDFHVLLLNSWNHRLLIWIKNKLWLEKLLFQTRTSAWIWKWIIQNYSAFYCCWTSAPCTVHPYHGPSVVQLQLSRATTGLKASTRCFLKMIEVIQLQLATLILKDWSKICICIIMKINELLNFLNNFILQIVGTNCFYF